MQYLGEEGTTLDASIQAKYDDLVSKAAADLSSRSIEDAAKTSLIWIFSAAGYVAGRTSRPQNEFTSEHASRAQNYVIKAYAYADTLSRRTDYTSLSSATSAQLSETLKKLDDGWAILKLWDSSLGDTHEALLASKRAAVESGDLNSSVLTDDDRRYVMDQARRGNLAYTFGPQVQEVITTKYITSGAPPVMNGSAKAPMGMLAIGAVAVGAFLLSRG